MEEVIQNPNLLVGFETPLSAAPRDSHRGWPHRFRFPQVSDLGLTKNRSIPVRIMN